MGDINFENEVKEKLKTIKQILLLLLESLQLLDYCLLVVGCVILLCEGYSTTDDIDTSMTNIGISSFGSFSDAFKRQNDYAIAIIVLNLLNIVLQYVLCILWTFKEKLLCKCMEKEELQKLFCILVIISSAAAGITTVVGLGVLASERNPDLFEGQDTVKSLMKTSLKENFISDNITSTNMKSNEWNRFFMKHRCCGIDAVFGTTNDFDTTPWCTSSGSCQQTNSQIPKTGCKYSTISDFSSARSGCHASVSDNAYYETGCFRLLYEKLEKMREARRQKIYDISYAGGTSLICMIITISYLVKKITACKKNASKVQSSDKTGSGD